MKYLYIMTVGGLCVWLWRKSSRHYYTDQAWWSAMNCVGGTGYYNKLVCKHCNISVVLKNVYATNHRTCHLNGRALTYEDVILVDCQQLCITIWQCFLSPRMALGNVMLLVGEKLNSHTLDFISKLSRRQKVMSISSFKKDNFLILICG